VPSFASEARADSTWKPRVECNPGRLINDLPEGERAEVIEAFLDDDITVAALTRALEKRYKRFSSSSVGRHRMSVRGVAGGCQCGLVR